MRVQRADPRVSRCSQWTARDLGAPPFGTSFQDPSLSSFTGSRGRAYLGAVRTRDGPSLGKASKSPSAPVPSCSPQVNDSLEQETTTQCIDPEPGVDTERRAKLTIKCFLFHRSI